MDKERSSYIKERKYRVNKGVEMDPSLTDYWKKVIGEKEYYDVLKAYRIDDESDLFSDKFEIDDEFKNIEVIEKIYEECKYKDINLQIVEDKKQKLVFENFFVPFVQLGVYMLRGKNGEVAREFEFSFSHTLLERLCQISMGSLMFEMQLNKKEGNLEGSNSREEYLYYNQRYLSDSDYIKELFNIYPCLERMIFENICFLTENYTNMIQRLNKDHSSIVKTFCSGKEYKGVINVQASISDSHRKGNTVAIITLDNDIKVVYKPRTLEAEMAYQNFVCDISSECKNQLKPVHILNYEEYGWEEFIQVEPCHDINELKRYYYRFGILVFANYILNANDLHVENVIAMGEYPMVIDAETILDNKRAISEENSRDLINDIIHESVLYSGLLPYYDVGVKRVCKNSLTYHIVP